MVQVLFFRPYLFFCTFLSLYLFLAITLEFAMSLVKGNLQLSVIEMLLIQKIFARKIVQHYLLNTLV